MGADISRGITVPVLEVISVLLFPYIIRGQ